MRRLKHRPKAGAAPQKEAVAAMRGALRARIEILEQIRAGLLRDAERIAPSPSEVDPDVDLEELDDPTEVRSVTRNVAEDYLRPAIDDLRDLLKDAMPGQRVKSS
jgi:hypothetical protein